MGCPVHIWVPMAAALAPVATVTRDKVLALMPQRKPDVNPADHIAEMRRWAPVANTASDPAGE